MAAEVLADQPLHAAAAQQRDQRQRHVAERLAVHERGSRPAVIASSGGRSSAMAEAHHGANARAADPVHARAPASHIALVHAEMRKTASDTTTSTIPSAEPSMIRDSRSRSAGTPSRRCRWKSSGPRLQPAPRARQRGSALPGWYEQQRLACYRPPRRNPASPCSHSRRAGSRVGIADHEYEVGVPNGDVRPTVGRAGVGHVDQEPVPTAPGP